MRSNTISRSRSKTRSRTRISQLRINPDDSEPNRMLLCENKTDNDNLFCISKDMKSIQFKGSKYIKKTKKF